MDVMNIIKDSFVFPSKNIKLLLIFELLSIIAGAFSVIGTIVYVLGFITPECFMWGGIAVIVSMVIGWILSGYLISVIKSGIELDDDVPEFEWWDNFNNGFNYFIVSIVYYIIPAVIVVVVGYLTNIFGNVLAVAQEVIAQGMNIFMGTTTVFVSEAMAQAMVNLAVSLAITATIAVILFVIFSFLQTIAGARLANTGSLTEALNIFESAKDIKRIGVGKVIILILLVIIIIAVIEAILSAIYSYVPILSILSIIITPYLIFFAQRAVGLLYSDIA
ncbi:MAG: DUF4013 domain-containing protein [Methanobrevibacter sp.]|nr:DUF4013 domain-containing protein [Methanobrevibacter sp.]